ncbi:MAG: hypothetical protein H6663_13210 [Candidatus Promineofilum sp.]|nr:hypothetical protein [Promineifilum sp.]
MRPTGYRRRTVFLEKVLDVGMTCGAKLRDRAKAGGAILLLQDLYEGQPGMALSLSLRRWRAGIGLSGAVNRHTRNGVIDALDSDFCGCHLEVGDTDGSQQQDQHGLASLDNMIWLPAAGDGRPAAARPYFTSARPWPPPASASGPEHPDMCSWPRITWAGLLQAMGDPRRGFLT